MQLNFLSFAIKSSGTQIETLLFHALEQLIEIGGNKARRRTLTALLHEEDGNEVPEIKNVAASLLNQMGSPVMLREPTTKELLEKTIELIEKLEKKRQETAAEPDGEPSPL